MPYTCAVWLTDAASWRGSGKMKYSPKRYGTILTSIREHGTQKPNISTAIQTRHLLLHTFQKNALNQLEHCQFLFQWCDKDCILSKITRTCHKSLLQRPQTPQSRQDKNWLKRFTVARERALSSISTIPQKRQMSYCLSSSMDWLQSHFSKIVTSLATLFS